MMITSTKNNAQNIVSSPLIIMECMDKIINRCLYDWTRGKFEMYSSFKMLFISSDKNNKKGKSAGLLILQYILCHSVRIYLMLFFGFFCFLFFLAQKSVGIIRNTHIFPHGNIHAHPCTHANETYLGLL